MKLFKMQSVRYVGSSILAFLIDKLIFFITQLFVKGVYSVLISNICARTVSSLVNFTVNRLIFKKGGRGGGKFAIVKYYILVVVQLCMASLIESIIINLLGVDNAGLKTLITLPVDGCIFVVNYFAQKYWVFAERKPKNTAEEES